MFKPIYKNEDIFYKQLKPPCGPHNYALWQPVYRFLCFWIPWGQRFRLDDFGFEPVNRAARRQQAKAKS